MKKRLLSMLMAVLMIASLVPATALADSNHANCDVLSVNIAVDPAKKQAGIEFAYCNTDNEVVNKLKVTPFADKAAINKCAALGHNWKTVELQAAACDKEGIAITVCADCGTYKDNSIKYAEAKGHVYGDFTVYVKPTCENDGWGYAICTVCKNPVFIASAKDAVDKLPEKHTTAQVKALEKLFGATNPDHADKDALVVADKDVYTVDELGNQTLKYKAPVEPTHVATVEWDGAATTIGNAELKVWKANVTSNNVEFTQEPADKTRGGGVGHTGDAYCPDCGDIVVPDAPVLTNGNCLNDAHAAYMTVKAGDEGYYPYIDAAGKHDGRTDRVWCDACKAYFGGDVLPFDEYYNPYNAKDLTIGQTFVIPQVDATCQKAGHTQIVLTWGSTNGETGWTVTSAGKEIPMKAHHYVKLADVAPTCDEDGYGLKFDNVYACDNVLVDENGYKHVCGAVKDFNEGQVQFVYPNHETGATYVTKVIVEPTCTTEGLSVKYCTACGEYALNLDKEPAVYTVPVVACTAAADLANVKEATCTEDGYTGDSVCKWCGKVLKAGEVVKAAGHTPEEVAAVAATCTETGLTAGSKCSVCGEVLTAQEVVPALGHKFENGVCTVCGEKDPNYVEPVAPEFKDADSIKDYAKDAVAWAAKEGVVKGDDQGNFNPTANITRQDFVTMLWRLKGETASEKELTFGDKADIKDYAQTAVAWAVENGYITGRDNGNFDPAAKITRAEIVAILNRVADNAKAEKAASFTDIGSHWAKDAIAWAAEAGIVNGVGNDLFAPNDNATRQDTVVMLYKFVNLK